MARFHKPAKRREKRQANSSVGAVNKVPDELLHYEFGAVIRHTNVRPWSSLRLLREGDQICLQIEDNTAGGESWMSFDEFKGLLIGLEVAARGLR